MKTPPPITIGVVLDRQLYALNGFEAFERFMLLNDPTYRRTSDQAGEVGLNTEDRLRLLVSAMSRRTIEIRKMIVDLHQKFGFPPTTSTTL